jgi:hypothetical protein
VAVNDYDYSIFSAWVSDRSRPEEIGARFLELLDRLGRIDPVFRGWEFVPLQPDDPDLLDDDGPPILPSKDNIAELVLENVARDDFWQPDPDEGYRPLALTQPPDPSRSMHLSVTAGSRWNNKADLRAGGYKAPLADDLVRYPLFREALLAIVAIWRPAWARVQGFKMETEHIPRGALTEIGTKSQHRMTWMAYLSADLSKDLKLPSRLHTELTPDGGLLMIAAAERLDPDNAEHMAFSDALTAMMAERRPEPAPISPPLRS